LYSLPFPFSLAFYTQYACTLTCNTQPLQKEISVRGGYVIYINISPKNDIPVEAGVSILEMHSLVFLS
jgi:hypothetical protein